MIPIYANLYPSGLEDVRNSADTAKVLVDNFTNINNSLAYTVQPYLIEGSPTTDLGPPTSGENQKYALWVDASTGVWECIVSGDPGTWIQRQPATLTAFPSDPPTNYWVIRTDLAFTQYIWNGSSWEAIGGGGGGSSTGSNLGTGSDGEGWYDSNLGSVLQFRRVKAGENIALDPSANYVGVGVTHDPHFIGTTWVDVLKLLAIAAPTPAVDTYKFYTTASGLSPNRVVTLTAMDPNGSEVIISSVIL